MFTHGLSIIIAGLLVILLCCIECDRISRRERCGYFEKIVLMIVSTAGVVLPGRTIWIVKYRVSL